MDTYIFRKQIHRLPGKVIHAIPLPEPEVVEGHQSRMHIGEICKQSGYKHVLLVTDKTLSQLGYEQAIIQSLAEAGVGYSLFNEINSEPTINLVEAGRKVALESQAECIIALGGGSVLDTSKMVAASVKMPHLPIKALLLKFLPVRGGTLPIIAVPSTAGTGAEVTVGAVVLNEHGVKSSTVLIGLNVTHVVLDSELTLHAPQKVTAACGMDALSHCIEGAVSDVEVDEEDMRLSMEGVRLILEHLPVVMHEPENIESRLAMCRAAMYGGNAINTQLAGYVHAFAHSIGAKYHIPHGQAITMMMLPVLKYQKATCLSKYAMMARYCRLVDEHTDDGIAADKFLQTISDLIVTCGLDKLESPVQPSDYEELTHLIAADSINYSAPMTFSNEDIQRVLEQLAVSSCGQPRQGQELGREDKKQKGQPIIINNMKKTILSVLFLMAATAVFAQKEMTFVVEGPEQSYNQVRVVNETPYTDFRCRVVVLNEDKTVKEVYGDYELKEKGDSDSNTKNAKSDRIQKGTPLAVKFPKNFKHELSFYVEYRDYPLFDVIVIHLTDKDGGYEEY